MDVQLQELIEKIKKDGVSVAETTAAGITADAEKKAATIISDAEAKAAELIKSAKLEAQRLEQASVASIEQAGRNLILAFNDGILSQVSALINAETAKAYNADMLKKLIPDTVKEWMSKNGADSVAVLLSEKDLKDLESSLKAALKAEIAKGTEIKVDNSLTGGFRIGEKDGSAYYDFSAEAVAELFSAYVNPRVAQILKDAAGGKA